MLATGLLDTEPEQPFDGLAEVAAAITGCERAFITLVDGDRSFWKSCVGVGIQRAYIARKDVCVDPVTRAGCSLQRPVTQQGADRQSGDMRLERKTRRAAVVQCQAWLES